MFSSVLTQMAAQPITWQQLNAFGARARGEDNLLKVKAASIRKGRKRTGVTLNVANVLDARRAAELNISPSPLSLLFVRGLMRAGRLVGEHKRAKRTQTTTVTSGYAQCLLSRSMYALTVTLLGSVRCA